MISFTRFTFNDGRVLRLKTPIHLEPVMEDGIFTVKDDVTGINTYGESYDDLIASIADDVEAIWCNYVYHDWMLTQEAGRIGDWWRVNAYIERSQDDYKRE